MRILYCATLVFSIIPDASKRVAASPLPLLGSQEWLVTSRSSIQPQFLDPHVPESRQSSSSGYAVKGSLPVATQWATTAALQVALENSDSTSSHKSRGSSSHRSSHRTSSSVNSVVAESQSLQPTTLFVTAPRATTATSTSLQLLSPLSPLNNGGSSAMMPIRYSSDAASKALPWILGFLLPVLAGAALWIVILHRKRKQLATTTPVTMNPSDAPGMAGYLESSSSLDKLAVDSQTEGDVARIHNVILRPGDKMTQFPTRNELCEYVFPPTSVGVQREILVERQLDSSAHPSKGSTLLSSKSDTSAGTKPLDLSEKDIIPSTLSSRPQVGPKKRFSPLGDVLYSTSGAGKTLETMEEENNHEFVYEIFKEEMDDAVYKPVDIDFAPGPISEQAPLATSTSYHDMVLSPTGLRARRRSSPVLPPLELHTTPEFFKPTYSPILGRLRSTSVGRQCSDAASRIGQLISTAAERVAPSPKTSAAEEERKFTEFIKGLVRGMNARDKKRALQVGVEEPTVIYSTAADSGEHDKYQQAESVGGLSILLPPPSFGAKLSDFSSLDTLISDAPPSSSERLSIGVAL